MGYVNVRSYNDLGPREIHSRDVFVSNESPTKWFYVAHLTEKCRVMVGDQCSFDPGGSLGPCGPAITLWDSLLAANSFQGKKPTG